MCISDFMGHYWGLHLKYIKEKMEDNIKDWAGLDFNSSQRAAEDRQRWPKIVADVSSGAPHDPGVSGTQLQIDIHIEMSFPPSHLSVVSWVGLTFCIIPNQFSLSEAHSGRILFCFMSSGASTSV